MSKRLAVILGIGGALRLGWVLYSTAQPVTDALWYRNMALSVVAGHGIQLFGHPSAFWTPGWPLWLALIYRTFGPSDDVVRIVNLALALLTILLTERLGRKLFSPAAGLVAAAFIAILPSLVTLPRYLLSENLAIPLTLAVVLLTLWSLESPNVSRFLILGLACGASILVREENLALCGGVGLYLLLCRGSIRARLSRVVPLAVGVMVILAPWVVRNALVLGDPTLATASGWNLWISFGPKATGGWVASPYPNWLDGDWGVSEAEMDRHLRSVALDMIRTDPGRVVRLIPAKLAPFLTRDDWALSMELDSAGQYVFPGGASGVSTYQRVTGDAWLILSLLALVGLPRAVRERPILVALLLPPFLAAMLSFGDSRFHAVYVPLLAIVAGRYLAPSSHATQNRLLKKMRLGTSVKNGFRADRKVTA